MKNPTGKDTRFNDLSDSEIRTGFFFLLGYLGRDHEAVETVSDHLDIHYPKETDK